MTRYRAFASFVVTAAVWLAVPAGSAQALLGARPVLPAVSGLRA